MEKPTASEIHDKQATVKPLQNPPEGPLPSARPNELGPVVKESSAGKFHKEFLQSQITGLNGKACKTQPQNDEVSALKFRQKLVGCHYLSGDATESVKAQGLDLGSAYEEALRESVYIVVIAKNHQKLEGYSGTGVVVAQTPDKTYILTDRHVVDLAANEGKVSDRTVTANDGHEYKAHVLAREKAADLALIEIDVGSRDSNYLHVANIADDGAMTQKGEPIVFGGYPENTRSLYMSPGRANVVHKQYFSDDIQRRVLNLRAKGSFGNSGGPVLNASHQLIGLIEGGSKKDMEAIIVSKALVDKWLKPYGLTSR